jgi:hypothetical protein
MSVLQLPPETEKMREFLFEMPVPFSMRAADFETYWPLIDNVWSRYDEFNVVGKSDKIPYDSIRFVCRFARKLDDEPSRANPPSKRKRREGGTCSCRVKAKRYHGVKGLPDHYRFEHSSPKESDWAHSHTIDESDNIKINSFLKAAAAIEAAKGYMPAEVYKNLRGVKIIGSDGMPVDALDTCGGKFMTRVHTNNAKQSALSAAGGRFLSNVQPAERKAVLKKDQPEPAGPGFSVAERAVWPTTLGKISEDHEEHAKNIKADVRSLVESIAIGKRTQIPRDVLLPLLNSIAGYIDNNSEDPEAKPLLETILRVQEVAGIARTDSSRAQITPTPAPISRSVLAPAPTRRPIQAPELAPMFNGNQNSWYAYG